MTRIRRIALSTALVLAAALVIAPASQASFHLMSIRAVHAGTGGLDPDYVELQMYAPGQNLVGGHHIRTYDGGGTQLSDFTLPSNVPNGDNNRTILIANGPMTPTPDATANGLGSGVGSLNVVNNNGAVCWAVDTVSPPSGIDCVSYGPTFPGFAAGTPSPTGTPAAALPDGSTLVRTITPNCSTQLDAADDTNNSSADFSLAGSFTPRNNAGAVTELACPTVNVDKGPKKTIKSKKKKAKVTVKFSSDQTDASFACKLDKADFAPCTSPFKFKAKKGKHTFDIQAANPGGGVSQTPAEVKFKVKKKK